MTTAPGLATDVVVHGDCLDEMNRLPDGAIDLVYLDPPFNTGRRHMTDVADWDDRWSDIEAYLAFIRPRIEAAWRVLRPSGSLLLHCDWRTVHHLRLALEKVFGPEQFVNHLVWHYGLGGSSPRRFSRKHDDILFYGRSEAYWFDPPMVPSTSRRMDGRPKKATDVLDIPAINNMAQERTGYPTQKPIALLELLVAAACPPGGIVLDPFCGSGTTLVAAKRTGRRFMGIDTSADAVRISRERLESLGTRHP